MDNQLATELKEHCGIVFHDVDLLEQAFTHSSYVSEHHYLKLFDNGRLEFLGDAVLELIASQYLYLRFPELPEGELTEMRIAIVRGDSLAKFAKECRFDNCILLGRGEEASGGRARALLLYDLSEAFLGALYLNQKVGTAKKFIEDVVFPKIDADAFSHKMDYKTQLQEILQRKGDVSIEHCLIKKKGPAHDRTSFTEVYMNGKLIGLGQGKSRKLVEQDVAERTLKNIPQ